MVEIKGKVLLEDLLAEIDNCDPELLPPPNPVDKGEKQVGILEDEYIRKVFSLNNFYLREGKRLQIDLECSGEDLKSHGELHMIKQKYETLLEMFWYLLRAQFDLWKGDIGIRKGWVVVQKQSEDSGEVTTMPFPKFLRKLIEGMD